jgi:hypothetical protein
VILASLDYLSSSYVDERSRTEPPDGRPVRSIDRWSLVIVRPATEGKPAFALRASAGHGRKRIRTAERG